MKPLVSRNWNSYAFGTTVIIISRHSCLHLIIQMVLFVKGRHRDTGHQVHPSQWGWVTRWMGGHTFTNRKVMESLSCQLLNQQAGVDLASRKRKNRKVVPNKHVCLLVQQ